MHKNHEIWCRLFCYNVLKWVKGVIKRWGNSATNVVIIDKEKEEGIHDIKSDFAEYD